jgi:hypothetical protein
MRQRTLGIRCDHTNHAYMIRQVQRMSKGVNKRRGSPERRGWELCNRSARAARQANNLHMKLSSSMLIFAPIFGTRQATHRRERERRLRKVMATERSGIYPWLKTSDSRLGGPDGVVASLLHREVNARRPNACSTRPMLQCTYLHWGLWPVGSKNYPTAKDGTSIRVTAHTPGRPVLNCCLN